MSNLSVKPAASDLAAADRPGRKCDRLCRAIQVVIGIVLIAIWAVAFLSTASMRQTALRSAIANANNLSASFEDELAHTLGSISLTFDAIAARMRAEHGKFDFYRWSRDIPWFRQNGVAAAVVGPDGKLIATTRSPSPPPRYIGDLEHVRIQLDGTAKGLYIGKPVVPTAIGKVEIPISERVTDTSGRLLGVVSMIVPPNVLVPLHKAVDLGAEGVVTLVGTDAIIRARFSESERTGLVGIGQTIAGGPAPSAYQPDAAGYYVRSSVVDRIPRLFSYRRVGNYPLVVYVGYGLDDVYAGAVDHGRIVYSLAAAMTLLLAAFAAYLTREIRIRAQHESALRAERENLEAANRKLLDSNHRAEAANHAKSVFLANMSHELRTPLNAVIGFSEIIETQALGPNPSLYSDYAKDIHSAGAHLLALINNVLDTARMEVGKLKLTAEPVEIREIAQAALLTVREQARVKSLTFEKQYPETPVVLNVDPLRMRQVLINLLANAVKFTPVRGRISLCISTSPDAATIAVTDTGIGMSPEEVAVAMEPFQKIETALVKQYEGAGLGLSLAKRITEMHGGKIEIESIKGAGTTVRIVLPPACIVSAAVAEEVA